MYEVAISSQHVSWLYLTWDQNQAIYKGFLFSPSSKLKTFFHPVFSAPCSPNLQTNTLH